MNYSAINDTMHSLVTNYWRIFSEWKLTNPWQNILTSTSLWERVHMNVVLNSAIYRAPPVIKQHGLSSSMSFSLVNCLIGNSTTLITGVHVQKWPSQRNFYWHDLYPVLLRMFRVADSRWHCQCTRQRQPGHHTWLALSRGFPSQLRNFATWSHPILALRF